MRLLWTCVVFALLLCFRAAPSSGHRVLMLQSVGTGSHEFVLRNLGKQLTKRGHNVTQVRWLEFNSRPVSADCPVEVLDRRVDNSDGRFSGYSADGVLQPLLSQVWTGSSLAGVLMGLLDIHHGYCQSALGDTAFVSQLKERHFDVAIVDTLYNTCALALARILNLPVIGTGIVSYRATQEAYLQPLLLNSPSAVVAPFSQLGPGMTLPQRLGNLAARFCYWLGLKYVLVVSRRYIQTYYPAAADDVLQLHRDVDILLINTNFHVDQPVFLPANVQTVGCLQCRPPEPLPTDLAQYFNSSGDHGVIVFSLGITLYNPDRIPTGFLQILLRVMSELPQKVVMRLELTRQQRAQLTIPKNVLLVTWLPQIDALGQRQTRLFITHCGIGGVMEAVYSGVPMLGIPLHGDQKEIAKFLEYRGLGLALDLFALTEDDLRRSIRNLLQDERYGRRVARESAIWRSERRSPADRFDHWIRRVSRRRAETRSPARGQHSSELTCSLPLAALLVTCLGVLAIRTLSTRTATQHTSGTKDKTVGGGKKLA